MTAGLQIFNDSDVLIIDESYQNVALASKGTATFAADSSTFSPSTGKSATFTITGTAPILAWNSTYSITLVRCSNTGTSWTFQLWSDNSMPAGTTVPYYVFDLTSSITPTETVGLEVFDASGVLKYHSSKPSMKIVGVINLANPAIVLGSEMAQESTTVTYTAGRTYAVTPASAWTRNETYLSDLSYGSLPLGSAWYEDREYGNFASISSNAVTCGTGFEIISHHSASGSTSSNTKASQYGELRWLVMDVTNF